MTQNFIFYDTETSGRDPFFDQIFQFAAVLTDSELQPIDQFEVRSRRLPQVVPSPGALLVNGLSPETLDQAQYSNYEFAGVISKKIREWSPAIISGYNIFSFDERFLRSLFYQNLYPVYQTQSLGNARVDILPLVQACEVIAPSALVFPLNEKGRTSKKLEHIASANGFANHNAHDALGDVEATIYVANLIKQRVPVLWNAALRARNRRSFKDTIDDGAWKVFQDNNFGWPVTYPGLPIAQINDGRDILCVDLRNEVPDTNSIYSDDNFRGRNRFFRQLKCAEVPLAFSWDDASQFEVPLAYSQLELTDRAERWKSAVNEHDLITAFVSSKPDYPVANHVEQKIYEDFGAFNSERGLMDAFHGAEVHEKLTLASHFLDKRFRVFAKRILFDNFAEFLALETLQKTEQAIEARISSEEDVPWLTVGKALEELAGARTKHPNKEDQLNRIELYLKNLVSR